MGVVYRARQISLNRIIALKMILSGQIASDSEIRRFQFEAEAEQHSHRPERPTHRHRLRSGPPNRVESYLSRSGTVVGTPGFMLPEQAAGNLV